jgi:hypothetical protein
MSPLPDDELAARLRAALTRQAADATTSDDSLGRIRSRTAAERGPVRRWLPVAVATAAAVVAVAVVAVLLGPASRSGTGTASGPTAGPTSPGPTSSDSGAPSPSPSASESASTSPSSPPGGTAHAVPAYYVRVFEGHARLYREFHRVVTTDAGVVAASLATMLAAPADPDYASLWPVGTTVTALTRTGAGGKDLTVVLSAAPTGFADVAVQQVVYTVTAADPDVAAVTVTYPGGSSGAVGRVVDWQILAPVWVLAPVDGAHASSPLKLSGTASVFEATVSWQVARADGTVAASGAAMATIGAPGRGAWSVSVPLPPGTYTVTAWEASAQDGRVTWPDTKVVVVG